MSITGWIHLPRILKSQMNSLLQRLNPLKRPMCYHGSTTNLVIRLQPLDFPKEKVYLIDIATPGIPARLLHRRAGSSKRKKRRHVPNIKPHLLPVDDLVTQHVQNILWFLPLTKLQRAPPTTSISESLGWGFRWKKY